MRRAGCALIILVVESGDLVSGGEDIFNSGQIVFRENKASATRDSESVRSMADFFNACGDSGFGREAAAFYGLVLYSY